MKLTEKVVKYLKDENYRFSVNNYLGFYKFMDDERFLKMVFEKKMKTELDLEEPKTFNEKLNWLKLFDRNPMYTTMVDKYASKQFMVEKIGEEYVVPSLGGPWYSFDEIDFDTLPERFVLKTNHDSGGVILCKNKNTLDKKRARAFFKKHLSQNYYWRSREWPYKNIKPCIFAEEFLDDGSGDAIYDYKFFCFNGEPKIMYLSRDKSEEPRTDFFDMEYRHLDMRMRDPNADVPPDKPMRFEEMKRLAGIVSQNIPHVRVDFFMVGERLYIGETTFFHCGGFVSVKPESWNVTMGDWITLPERNGENNEGL